MFAQVRARASRPNPNFVCGNIYASQFREVPNTYQLARGEFSRGKLHHHIRATRNGKPRARLAGQQRQHGRQAAGRDQFVIRGMRSQAPAPRRAASTTASSICVYPVQRQRLPDSPSRISSRVGRGFSHMR